MSILGVKAAVFLAVNAVLALAVLMIADRAHHYEPWETDSLFEANPADEDYDLIILGTSRAYALSRFRDNHQYLEDTLDMNVLNLGLPTAGGVKPARCYFDHYLDAGVRPECVVYLIDPFVFYGVGPNEYHKFVYFERFDPGFLLRMAKAGMDWRRLLIYVRSKFTADWFFREAEPLIRHERKVSPPVSDEAVAQRVKSLFLDGREEANFLRYADHFEAILARCKAAGIPVVVAYPPTLLGDDPAQTRMEKLLDDLEARYAFTRYDWANALRDPGLFYDLDHLNVWGVQRLVDDLLAPAVRRQAADSGAASVGAS
jgi:hypothetical protein